MTHPSCKKAEIGRDREKTSFPFRLSLMAIKYTER